MDEILDYCIRVDGIPSQTIEFTPERKKKYGWNNGKVSFFDENGAFYVTPFCVEVSRMLEEKGYSDGYLYVPFSNGEIPEDPFLRDRWEKLCLEARAVSRERQRKEKEERFRKAAEEKGLKPLSEGAYEMCLRIPEEGLRTTWFGEESKTMPLLEWEATKYMGTYCQNNGKVSFIDEKGVMYVSPFSEEIKQELREAGYSQGSLYVPLSNGEEIVDNDMNEKWTIMCLIARRKFNERQKKEKLERCHKYAEEKGISSLPQEVYDMCLEIPEEGLRTSWFGEEGYIYPLMEYQIQENMGIYCQNNGKVSFIDENGRMQVTPYCFEVAERLAEAGYRRGSLYVPLSNGEDIVDPVLAKKWSNLCEGAREANNEYQAKAGSGLRM